ncbi:hypothetical protein LSCM1_07157 [Leishmania martiniquensis]|uniref:Leucine-rich repeat protein (LRRP) n=1 Tax=Leishmania martiniquensis TaxID=1580590 RepID=A0A836H2L6_9TRYP|nr:hypothetical protein LSCM1_07157 [Leishmania martiniquensis]
MQTSHTLALISGFLPQPPCAMIAAGPVVRCATERRDCLAASATHSFTVERITARHAREKGVCLALADKVQEVMVITCRPAGRKDGAQAALEVAMWWVDRCLRVAAEEAAEEAAPLFCCMRIVDVAVERLMLYSSEDSPVSGVPPCLRMRMPRCFLALQLFRLSKLRHVQLSPSVRRRIVELDVWSCLRWPQSDVNSLLTSLQSPLRAVRVATCSVSPVKLLNKFHASLRVVYLFRRTSALRDPTDTRVPVNIEDEEYEEEESNQSPSLMPGGCAPAAAQKSSLLPEAAQTISPLPPTAAPLTALHTTPTTTSVSGTRGRRTKRVRLSAAAAVAPVLEELYVESSSRRSMPRWVETCTRLRHVTLRNCAYSRVDSLRFARALTSVVLEGCGNFVGFDIFRSFPQLQSVTVKSCALLRDLYWLPRLTGALRSLCIHHTSSASLTAFASAAFLGAGLSGLEQLNLSIPSLHALRPFMSPAAASLRELTLFACLNLNGFADLPPLPVLEKVVITGNRHMQNFLWLAKSPRVVEVRATQCTQLTSMAGLDALHLLRVLDINGCQQVRGIAPLAECRSLTYLDVSHCGLLTRVSALKKLPRLQYVLMHNCTSLAKDFGWIEGCPKLVELMVPGPAWIEPAANVLHHLGRCDVTLR